jgi:hypothetical protein
MLRAQERLEVCLADFYQTNQLQAGSSCRGTDEQANLAWGTLAAASWLLPVYRAAGERLADSRLSRLFFSARARAKHVPGVRYIVAGSNKQGEPFVFEVATNTAWC